MSGGLQGFLQGIASRVDPAVGWAIAGVFVLLVVATFAVWLPGRLKPQADFRELRLRVRTWWIMAAVFFLALTLSRRVSLAFFALLSFLALKELYTSSERWDELQALYRKRIADTVDADDKLDLLLQLCFLFEEILDNPEQAIDAYQQVLALSPDHAAAPCRSSPVRDGDAARSKPSVRCLSRSTSFFSQPISVR